MGRDLVSVIIPTYNSSQTIISCIQSVLKQTYPYIEIIVIDDGSTDLTVNVIEDFKNEYSIENLKVLKQKNSGPSVARNKGIEFSEGVFIAFLDSDDEWYPTKIEKQISFFYLYDNLALLGCNYSIGNKVPTKSGAFNAKFISFQQLLLKNYFITSTVICPKSIITQFLFNTKQKYSEDYRLWLSIASLGRPCLLIDDVLTKMNDKPMFGGAGLSSNLWLMEKGELSNYMFLYKLGNISFVRLLVVSVYSFLRYLRRVFLSI